MMTPQRFLESGCANQSHHKTAQLRTYPTKHLAVFSLTNSTIAEVVKTQDLFVASLQSLVFTVIFTESEKTRVIKT